MILAKIAAKVTTGRGNGKRQRAGIDVKQRLFLDRIDMGGNGFFINKGIELALEIPAHAAFADFSFHETAIVRTKSTLHHILF